MSRPLLVSDCDEVLLHMLTHFSDWVGEAHDIAFRMDARDFHEAATDRATGSLVDGARLWPLLDSFFEGEMHRQNVVPGAVEALRTIGEVADIVILTNIGDDYHAGRVAQLEAFDIRHEVLCNRGDKGPPLAALIERMRPSVTVFVDDLSDHHESVAKHAPHVWRLHMVAEPRVAAHMPAAERAHARIDDWESATRWILDRFAEGPAQKTHHTKPRSG